MATKVKMKIEDNTDLRLKIDKLYEKTSQIDLAKWSLAIAKHSLTLAAIDYYCVDEVMDGFKTNELWQIGEARIHDVRQASFNIHKIARESDSEIKKTALRVAAQAVGSGHIREHAMVASDYAVKLINLIRPKDFKAISQEREWQYNELKKVYRRQAR